MNSHFKTDPTNLSEGDILFTKDAIGRLERHDLNVVYRCEKCAMLYECVKKRMWSRCGSRHYFAPVEMTEEIEQARALFALKGELQ